MKIKCLFALLLISSLSVSAQKYFVKHVKFPAHATAEQKLDMASRLVPTSQQLEWQQMELTAFYISELILSPDMNGEAEKRTRNCLIRKIGL